VSILKIKNNEFSQKNKTIMELSFCRDVYVDFLCVSKENFTNFGFASADCGGIFMHNSILTDYDSEI